VKARVLASIACGFEAAVVVYAVTRVIEVLLLPQPNPALIIHSLHAGYFWRAWTSAYLGAFLALAIVLLARDPKPIARAALRALPWAAAIGVLQGLFVP
jgi:hypothetical protein